MTNITTLILDSQQKYYFLPSVEILYLNGPSAATANPNDVAIQTLLKRNSHQPGVSSLTDSCLLLLKRKYLRVIFIARVAKIGYYPLFFLNPILLNRIHWPSSIY
ncbi:hypothetical protein [Gracilibacillus alcaliphilus]|uniref:hypothetical protein n=1 Tax=Gracilibacillus alcaliphilus TaxID=1401441 RepID=UPI00195CF69A|nr:hypothetical protein [Gracilibacillus alcaliphilus]MBM7676847.1 hypothetical protein [Gracilibacillus alcaliphilus]